MPSANGVIDFFLHPSFNLLTSSTTSPSTIANPVTGFGNVLNATVGLSSSFGVVWAVSLAPAKAGYELGTFKTYDDDVMRIWVQHSLASGLVINDQQVRTSEQNGVFLWANLLPSTIIVDVFPNFEVTLEWLIGI